MRARGKQVLTIFMIVVLLLLFYTFYYDKLTFKTTTENDLSKSQMQKLQHGLTASDTVGKVITRNEKRWTIDTEICQRDYDFVLAHLKDPPNTPIFVYSEKEDVWVSKNIINQGSWEGGLVSKMLSYMQQFPNAVFIDLGANVGMFSISIAAHGHRVIAVDCLEGNVMRLCASMKAAKLTDKLTIVFNALSHKHEKVSLGTYKGNVGGTYVKKGDGKNKETVNTIYLDDLLDVYDFDQVVMKMDVETYEANVLKGAYKFFDRVKVEVLLMEFVAHRNKDSGKFIVDFLTSHGMEPDVAESNKHDYHKWGNEVTFLRKRRQDHIQQTVKESITFPEIKPESLSITSQNKAFGKIITYSGGRWISREDFCPSDTSKFIFTKLGHPYNLPIFVYTENEDKWVSGRIIHGGIWEDDLVSKILNQMDDFPEATFIDIGSNIGVFTLAVASHKRNVISVDCLKGNVERLCNSVKRAEFTDRVSIVYNAVSNERKNFSLGTYEGNVGGTYVKEATSGDNMVSSIYLDDLLTLFDLKEVVVKMDVETHEMKVLQGAQKFFTSVKVHYFLLEFVSHKGKESGNFIRNFFYAHEMEPILPSYSNFDDTNTWPNEVAWKKKTQTTKRHIEQVPISQVQHSIPLNHGNLVHSKQIVTEQETIGQVISRSPDMQLWHIANFTCQPKQNFVRANLNRDQNTPIYVYSQNEDKWVSGSIIMNGNWEGDLVRKIVNIFNEFPDAVFLDLGANVGMFSLSLAKLGKRVISFECLKGNVERLCASMKANPGFDKKMTIVYNALSNERDTVTLGVYKGNIGGTFVKKLDSNSGKVDTVDSILLDDILEIFQFNSKVIMKMDVETFEAKILEGSEKFFKTVEVEALLMEFVAHRGKKSGDFILKFLESHNLFPVLTPGMDKYDTSTWKKGEVMFRRKRN